MNTIAESALNQQDVENGRKLWCQLPAWKKSKHELYVVFKFIIFVFSSESPQHQTALILKIYLLSHPSNYLHKTCRPLLIRRFITEDWFLSNL